jgi:predicted RNase H-like nuclease (RuvC/YqgF family)
MSPIGKIFLLINFGLAFGFLFWASTAVSTNAQWKKQFDDEAAAHAATKTELENQLSEMQVQLNNEKSAKEARTVERDQAQADASRNREDLDAAKRANEQLRADIAKISETLDGYNTTIQNLEAAKDAAVADAREKERERDEALDTAQAAQDAQRNAEDGLREAQAQIAALETELTASNKQVAKLDGQVQTLVTRFNVSLAEIEAQPDIEGRVLQVDNSIQPGLVALNVGSNSGVKRGMTFEIFSGRDYKGQVKVENVRENMCSALIVGTPRMTIGQGDSAATNL